MIELLIVLVIAAILASIAWPAYQSQVFRGRRSDAMSGLAAISQGQERWRSNNPAYSSTIDDVGPAVSQGGHYDLSIVEGTATASAYTLLATVKSGSPQANDSSCRSLKMRMNAGNIAYTSSNSSSVANGVPDPCWVH